MSTREFYIQRIKAEGPAFAKVILAVPTEGGDYRPHPRSRSAAELAWLLATEASAAVELVDRHRVEWAEPGAGQGIAAAAGVLEHSQRELLERVTRLDDAAWLRKAEFLMGGKIGWSAPLGEMLWGLLFDAIHHRGQLSTYIRPAGGKVPSIYGPSGDDPGA
ncbi:MAG: DinB family protein [Acidobacteriota bacterium]